MRSTFLRRCLQLSILLTGFLNAGTAFSQQSRWAQGEVLIRLSKDARASDVQSAFARTLSNNEKIGAFKPLGKESRYFLLHIDGATGSDSDLKKAVARLPGVESTSLNYKLKFNATPNDALYGTQWNMEDSNVEPVWDFTTGGTMANGKRIGVGISDLAIQTNHPDLSGNIWPFSPAQGSGEGHGTEVASVVGAVGNNGIGIAGVNWDVEIVSSGETDDLSDVIEQFEFAISLREQFNTSNGVNGLLVVSITASWGVEDFGTCNGFTEPLFADMADAGILLVTSGPNESISIEAGTDFPSNCALAEHLVVTSYGPSNETPFAFGPNTVHLLAPGVDIPVATTTSTYTVADGNSFAIPMVAGAVALLYSIPCPSFAALVMNDPQAARTLVKNAILNNTTPFPGGDALTITGGKLNVNSAYQALMNACVPTCTEVTLTFTSSGNPPAQWMLTDWTGNTVATGNSGVLAECIEDGCFTAAFTDANGDPIAGSFELQNEEGDVIAADLSPDGVVVFSKGNIVAGCTTAGNSNFNPQANCDDGSCCAGDVVQLILAPEDLLSEGTAQVLVTSSGSTVYSGPLVITFSNDDQVSLGRMNLCMPPGCVNIQVISSTVDLFEEGFVILNGNEQDLQSFLIATGYFAPIGITPNVEVCDGLDNDCDGVVDNGFIYFVDADGDGYGAVGSEAVVCSPGPEHVLVGGDCDDNDPDVNPGMEDPCSVGDGIDNDCDGETDEDGISAWYEDLDGDGFGTTEVFDCVAPPNYTDQPGDCNDNEPLAFPGAEEVCDGVDNDCDGIVDNGFTWYTDADGDGFGDDATEQFSCTPIPDAVQIGGDCDDTDPSITAIGGACDDGDPDTQSDIVRADCTCLGFPIGSCPEGEIADCNGNCAPIEWIGDGFCDDGSFEWNGNFIVFNCIEYGNDDGDCGSPCSAEVCDGEDNDCDGEVDEDFFWYTDADGDGYGDDATVVFNCTTQPGMINVGGDCNDNDPAINPGATEICDGVDNNCDGISDAQLTGCTDPLACNYDPNAICDDGSCVLDTQPGGSEVYSPDWSVTDFNGNTVELYAMLDQGHTVILDLFTTWCPPSNLMLASGLLNDWNAHLGPDGLDHIRMVSLELEDTATAVSLEHYLDLASWPIVDRGGLAISQMYAALGVFPNAYPTFLMICPDRSVTQLYPLVNLLPADGSLRYEPDEGLQLLNDLCGCHSAPCTGLAGCTDPAACNYDPAATCADGTCIAGTPWYIDTDADGWGNGSNSVLACTQPTGFSPVRGDCNNLDPTVHVDAPELCDGIDNNCNGQVDEGFPLQIACPADVVVNATGPTCTAQVFFGEPQIICGAGYYERLTGLDDGSNFSVGTTIITFGTFNEIPTNALFTEDFADNAAGWTMDTEWSIGTASASTDCECGDDPDVDHTPTADNGLAGMVIGGCVDNTPHTFRYLTSPEVDATAVLGPLVLEFWRHIHADYDPYMDHVIDVFDGSVWVRVWTNDAEECLSDPDWAMQQIDVTGQKNSAFRVRFGQRVNEPDAFNTGGWSIDDVRFLGNLVPESTCSFNVTVVAEVWYADADNDGFGDATAMLMDCDQPASYVDNAGDCDDTNPAIFPGAPELCDGLDNDCNGPVDDGLDGDGDGIVDCVDGCPFLPGTIGSPCTIVPGELIPTGIINPACTCAVACSQAIVLDLRTDLNSQEASFIIRDENSSIVRCQGGGFFPGVDSPIVVDCCLPEGCFKLEVFDSGGDGFVSGGYQVREAGSGGRRIIDNFGNFASGGISSMSDNASFCLPIGDDKLTFATCDKLTWVNNQYLVAHANTAVSAEWVTGGSNAVQDANSGYAFWIFDPNGSYSFRRFRSHNVSDGFSPATAFRACHLKLNGWTNTALTPHVPLNTLMNVRVRGRVNGVNVSEFGPACRMILDPAAATCPQIWLQDDPSNASDFSCGVMRTWGGSNSGANKIVAKPPQFVPNMIPGPVRYQFSFRIPGEGICITRPPQSSPTLYLNWVTGTPLQCSKTYEVDVRASKDGGITWCVDQAAPACYPAEATPWGRQCSVTINACGTGPSGMIATTLGRDAHLSIFPNPNNGQLLHFAFDEPFAANEAHVEFVTISGSRVRKMDVQLEQGANNFKLELNGMLTSGMHMVRITVGDRTYTERLVIHE